MPENPAGLVYGTVTVAALLAAESARQETYIRTVGSVLITLVLYWLAHAYAEYAGHRLEHEEHFTYGSLARVAGHEFAVVLGAAIPLLVLLGGWAAGARLDSAVLVAIWTAAGTVVVLELVIGVRAGVTGHELVKQTVFGALLGLLVIALRVVLH
ncbi:MAG TPA: hypothetical protein VFN55_04480 [Solirubrobacteraceae bacterium]|nr:hypothetical protein [Solirubrobacteraceae bacterium]